jgi:hypothetical protein
MPKFIAQARKTTPMTDVAVEAPSREEAIGMIVKEGTDAGATVEVLQCIEVVSDTPPAPTGASGPAARR